MGSTTGGFGLIFSLVFGVLPVLLADLAQPAIAQTITEDSSLSTRVTANGPVFTIHDGTRSGPNLFHSFDEFSIPLNGSAAFNNANDVVNIIGRVTGSSASSINGTITANGLANLFLLNTNGIVIGPGAQLEIGGSFVASTAESLSFSDGTVFSTAPTPQPSQLTISTPTGLQLGTSSGAIGMMGGPHNRVRLDNAALVVQSASNLSVEPGRTLALIGNEVSLDGGRLSTTGGRIELGGIASGEVAFSQMGAGYDFDYSEVNEFADIEISQSLIDGISQGGGMVQLQGQNVSLLNGAEVYIQNQAPVNTSGGISINAAQQLTVAGQSPITGAGSNISAESLGGPSGDINVAAQSIEFLGSVGIETIAGLAPGGNVTVNATDSILLAPEVTARHTTGIDTLSFGPVYAPVPAGEIKVTTNQLTILNGATIASLAYEAGNSGNVTVTAQSIQLDGITPVRLQPSIITSGTFNNGNAGNVLVNTERLDISAGGRIDSSTAAAGNAGSVTVNATESVTVSGRVANSINPSLIISSANLLDEALKNEFDLPDFPTGDSGDLTINTPVLSVTDGAQVTVRNDGTGQGGTLRVNADAIQLQDAGITASTRSGGGGNINLTSTGPLLLRDGSILSAEAGGTGDGGNITLGTPFLIALENSDIVANAFEGNGGEIQISAQSLLGTTFREQLTAESDITASSEFGVSGVVTISNLEVDPSSGVVALPENVADYSNQISAGCSNAQQSRFVASGRGGLSPDPTRQIMAQRTWRDLREVPATNSGSSVVTNVEARRQTEPAQLPLVEASGWRVDSAGETTLYAATDEGAIAPTTTANCLAHREA